MMVHRYPIRFPATQTADMGGADIPLPLPL